MILHEIVAELPAKTNCFIMKDGELLANKYAIELWQKEKPLLSFMEVKYIKPLDYESVEIGVDNI